MPRKRITPGAREGLIATISVALYQPVPDAYRTWVTGANGFAILKVRKPFTDFVNVLQWLHTAVSSCKEDEISVHTVHVSSLSSREGRRTTNGTQHSK